MSRSCCSRSRPCARAGLKDFRLRFGDIALFYALLDALALPERWRLKLRHYFWRPPVFHALLARLAKGERPNGDGPAAALAASLTGLTTERAEELVGAYLDTRRSAARRQSHAWRDHRAAARSRRGSARRAAAAKRWRPSSTITSPCSAAAQGGGRAHRHDRQGCGHRSRRRARSPIRGRFERLARAASISAAPPSPPSSAAASNITRAWCSRSRSRRARREPDRRRRAL